MTALICNTLAFSKKLKLAGFTDKQAQTQTEIIAELFKEKIATKQDIKFLKKDILTLRKDMLISMSSMKKDILISVGGMIAGAVVLLPAVFKLVSLI